MTDIEQALYCMKQSADITVCEECVNYDICDHTKQKELAEIAVKVLEEQIEEDIILGEPDREFVEELVSVVRCKDCKHGYNGNKLCKIKQYFSEDGYCSKGEK